MLQLFNCLAPKICLSCQHYTGTAADFCGYCYQHLPWLSSCCECCSLKLDPGLSICASCKDTPKPFVRLKAAFAFQPPISNLIHGLKFGKKINHARILAKLLAAELPLWYNNTPLPELIIPVPLHPKRLASRGFNQSLEIARALALDIPICFDALIRQKYQPAQAYLPLRHRRSNTKDVFRLQKRLAEKRLVILDDVATTTNTLQALCKTIQQKLPTATIEAWCIARA